MNYRKLSIALVLIFMGGFIFIEQSKAFIVINEFLADPPPGLLGDANGDGVNSSTQDEFIELINYGWQDANISQWSLKDAVQTRHVFAQNSIIPANSYLVVFGGGRPVFTDVHWQVASTGTLSLNNTADTISLFDHNLNLIDHVLYDSLANHDQSLVRLPEGVGNQFQLHSAISEAHGKLYSPGTNIDGNKNASTPVPEPAAWLIFSLGAAGLRYLRFNVNKS